MTTKRKPYVFGHRRRNAEAAKEIPCKVCYRRCVLVDGRWCCPTHGPRDEETA